MAKIVTGHKGIDHITSDDVSSFQQGIVGEYDYLLSDSPEDFVATIGANNTISLCDAEIVIQGTHARIFATDSVQLEQGTVGVTRIDSIVARYTRDSDGIEDVTVIAKTGTTEPPELEQTDIRGAGTVREVALWNITINGNVASEPVRVIPDVKSLTQLLVLIKALQSSSSSLKSDIKSHSKSITTINTSIKSINDVISAIKTNKTFSDEILIKDTGTEKRNVYGAVNSFESKYVSSGSKTTIIDCCRLEVRNSNGSSVVAGLGLYSDGHIILKIGDDSYTVPFIQMGSVDITPGKTVSAERVGTVSIPKRTVKTEGSVTIDNKKYTIKSEGVLDAKDYAVTRDYYEKTVTITFPKEYTSTPRVIVTPHTVGGNKVHWGISDVTTKGFKIYLQRTSVTETKFSWAAFGKINIV